MAFRNLKGWLRCRRLRHHGIWVELPGRSWQVGDFDAWTVRPEGLGPDSVVYSFGIGNSVAWDLAMIDRFGATVHGFDPTPECVAWVAQQRLPEKFRFHPCGLADHDGSLALYPPRKPGMFNYSQEKLEYVTAEHRPVEVPVKRLATLARELGHDRVDVLKIDIEGGEFSAIPELLEAGPRIGQVLVEVHYHYPTRSLRDGLALFAALRRHGFRCFSISPRGLEFGFARA